MDPDVDRLALVVEEGRAIGEDYTLALAARLVLRHRRGPVVTNLSTSRLVEDVAREAGVQAIRAPVGEVNVAVRMRDEQAPIGGEGNGGVILPEVHLGRDAPIGAALLLQLLVEEGRPLSQIAGIAAELRDREGQARPAEREPGRGVRSASRGICRRRGGHAGRAATVLGGSLGARAAVGNGADRARDRGGADEAQARELVAGRASRSTR